MSSDWDWYLDYSNKLIEGENENELWRIWWSICTTNIIKKIK